MTGEGAGARPPAAGTVRSGRRRTAGAAIRRRCLSLGAGLLALSACSGEPRAAETNPDRDRAAAPSQPPAAQAQKAETVPDTPAPAPTRTAAAPETARRCGWLHNPTPGNWWLVDRDGEWILGMQGGDQAPGLDEMPDMSAVDWEETNGHYGHGCACLTLTVDPASRKVTRVADAAPKPLGQCRADKALPKP